MEIKAEGGEEAGEKKEPPVETMGIVWSGGARCR